MRTFYLKVIFMLSALKSLICVIDYVVNLNFFKNGSLNSINNLKNCGTIYAAE